jgi:hypothetical protein
MAINLNEIQELLNQAGAAAANEKEVRKGLTRIESLLSNITKEITNVYALLDGAEPAKKERKTRAPKEEVEVDPEAPYGRKKDGSPKVKPGRSKADEAAA